MIDILISIIIICCVLGLVQWAFSMIPGASPFKNIINVCLVLIAIIYILSFIPGIGYGEHWHHTLLR